MADLIPVPLPTDRDIERFFAKVQFGDSDCWIWRGARFTNGYGMFTLAGKQRRAHRVSYVWWNDEPGEGLDHVCNNRACVNPEHLRPLSIRENVLRGEGPTAVNARKLKPDCGHVEEFDYVDPRGWRGCRQCRREATRRYQQSLRN